MKIVVDTNIVFSCILNSSGKIGKILLHSRSHFQFYTCNFLQVELLKHHEKLRRLTKLPEAHLVELKNLVSSNITFIDENLLPLKVLQTAESLLESIDINDTIFVALARQLKAKLWTGDLQLCNGLRAKKFKDVITTAELSLLLNHLEQ